MSRSSRVLKKSIRGLLSTQKLQKRGLEVFSEFHGLTKSMKFDASAMARNQAVFQQPARSCLCFVLCFVLVPAAFSLSCRRSDTGLRSLSPNLKGEVLKILFVGDTSFGENYRGTPKRLKSGYDRPLKNLAPLLRASDFVIANLETPITDLPESPFKDIKKWNHWTHVEKAPEALRRHKLRTFSLANNHTLDFGMPGLEQTFRVMKSHGMNWFGAGLNKADASRPFTKTFPCGKSYLKLAVIGAFEYSSSYDRKYSFYADEEKGGANRLSVEEIGGQIRKIKEKAKATFVVIFPHWGKNYAWKTRRQTRDAHDLIDAGADLIIGHGGHVMQEIELYKNKWIVYGLGNFMFLSPGRYKHLKSLPFSYAAQLVLNEHRGKLHKRIRLYPILSDNKVTGFQPRPLNDEEFQRFTEALLGKSFSDKKRPKHLGKAEDSFGHFIEFMLPS